MARVTPPAGETWNSYIRAAMDAALPQTLANRRLVAKNIRLGEIAAVERAMPPPSLRTWRIYVSPGTVAPTEHRPWT
jgi:hypothetical protein